MRDLGFTASGLSNAAKRLRVDVPTIQAVAQVEAAGVGFLSDGRPKILFERHIFGRLTEHKHDQSAPDLSNRATGGYVGGAGEYPRLYRALQLDADAAVQAASWGSFQIMGFNWRACGEKSLLGFLLAMHHNPDAHLALFAAFVESQGLADELQRKDWAGFARRYNGPAYAENSYDTKLAAAYAAAEHLT